MKKLDWQQKLFIPQNSCQTNPPAFLPTAARMAWHATWMGARAASGLAPIRFTIHLLPRNNVAPFPPGNKSPFFYHNRYAFFHKSDQTFNIIKPDCIKKPDFEIPSATLRTRLNHALSVGQDLNPATFGGYRKLPYKSAALIKQRI